MIILIVLITLLGVAYWYTYPKLGHYLYAYSNALEAKLYGFTEQTIELEGITHTVWTNSQENKPILLLVHGFSASHAVWLRYAKFFIDDYHVVIPDLAGHGKTGFMEEWDYSIEAQSKRLMLLINDFGSERAHIVGNSMGGFIAAHMGRYYADSCLSITLIDPAGVSSPHPSKMGLLMAEGCNPFYINNDAEFARFYAMTMARPPFLPGIVKSALSLQYQSRRHELEKIFRDYNRHYNDLESELNAIKCPSMLIWGAKDDLIDVSSASVWSESLNCRAHIWYDLGHMPMLEAPERTACATVEFLNQQKN